LEKAEIEKRAGDELENRKDDNGRSWRIECKGKRMEREEEQTRKRKESGGGMYRKDEQNVKNKQS
jgi:hypothetical protein